MFQRTLLIAALLLTLPLVATAADDPAALVAEAPASDAAVEVAETAPSSSTVATNPATTVAVDAAPPALFVADFQNTNSRWGSCSQGSCNFDFQCGWMRSQCSLHSYPACSGGTGNGCQGECVCACS